jgi:hypothetical protein
MDVVTIKKVALGSGLTIVIGTHLAMLFDLIPMNTMADKQAHAYANLGASGLIIYAIT